MGLWKELNLACCNWCLAELIYCNQTLNEDRWMTSQSNDHRRTVIHLEKKPLVDLKWNTGELFCSVSYWKDLDSGLQKGIPEFIIWITEFGGYTWRRKKLGGRCSLFSLSDEMKLPGYEWGRNTACIWMDLPANDNLAPGFLALTNPWVGFSVSGKREKVLFEDSNKLDTAFNKDCSDPVFFWSSPIQKESKP